MTNLGTIIHGSDHETDYSLLYELASFDLRSFLYGRRSYQRYMEEHPSHYIAVKDDTIEAADFIHEATNLADGLNYLHHHLFNAHRGAFQGAHNDLKPDNILVVFDRNQKLHPIGLWKIADFGISKVKETKDSQPVRHDKSTTYLDPGQPRDSSTQLSHTTSKRNPGAFSPPEVEKLDGEQQGARKGDIWSFGAILSLILAFALGGSPLVQEMDKERNAKPYVNDRFYWRMGDMVEIKPNIADWLSQLSQRYPLEGYWIPECVQLIFRTLSIKIVDRPDACNVRDGLAKMAQKIKPRIGSQGGGSQGFDKSMAKSRHPFPAVDTSKANVKPEKLPQRGREDEISNSTRHQNLGAGLTPLATVQSRKIDRPQLVEQGSCSSAKAPALPLQAKNAPRVVSRSKTMSTVDHNRHTSAPAAGGSPLFSRPGGRTCTTMEAEPALGHPGLGASAVRERSATMPVSLHAKRQSASSQSSSTQSHSIDSLPSVTPLSPVSPSTTPKSSFVRLATAKSSHTSFSSSSDRIVFWNKEAAFVYSLQSLFGGRDDTWQPSQPKAPCNLTPLSVVAEETWASAGVASDTVVLHGKAKNGGRQTVS